MFRHVLFLALIVSGVCGWAQQPVTVTLDPGATQVNVAAQVLAGTVDPVDAVLTLNGEPVTVAPDGRFSYAATLYEGINTFLFAASATGFTDGLAKRDIYLDLTPPRVRFFSPEPGAETNLQDLIITGMVDDAVDGAPTLTRDTAPVSLSAGRFVDGPVTLVPGENMLSYTAYDRAGNSATFELTVTFDDQAPGVSLTAPAFVAAYGEAAYTVTFYGEDLAHAEVRADGAVVFTSETAATFEGTLQSAGGAESVTLEATARDRFGNEFVDSKISSSSKPWFNIKCLHFGMEPWHSCNGR